MKKITKILLLLGALSLMMTYLEKVEAETYNGKLYEVFWPDSDVEVFAAESMGYMDYNGWYIKSSIDNKIYYCIDPATPLEGSYVGSHNYIQDRNSMIEKSKLSKDKLDKINLLAYYGYGYVDKNKKIDHTDKKWYGITQVMIWRVVRTDLTWTFKATRNGNPDSSLFKSEVEEMNNLVKNHYLKPSFSGQKFKLTINDEKKLTDTNKVLNEYKFYSTGYVSQMIQNNNSLKITADYPGKCTIKFIKRYQTNEKFGLFISTSYQDIIKMGAPEDEYFTFDLEVEGGIIYLRKFDKDTRKNIPQGDAFLEGAIYEVYNEEGESVGQITVNSSGQGNIKLKNGSYTVKEIKAPEGYQKDETIYNATLENNTLSLKVYDEVIKGTISIKKLKGGTGEDYTNEEGAIFEIYNSKGEKIDTITTNEEGEATITLPYGKYKLKQINEENEYANTQDIDINITENKTYTFYLTNHKLSQLVIKKIDAITKKPINDTILEIYNEENKLISTVKTNKYGYALIPNLKIGKYYIIEKSAPNIYKIKTEQIPFEIKENGRIVTLTIENERKKGILKFTKQDKETKKNLFGCKIEIYFTETNSKIYEGVTDKEGQINIKDLNIGKYCIKELEAPKGYLKNNKQICFEIKEENETVNIVMENNKITKVPNTMLNTQNIIKIIGIVSISTGIFLIAYGKKKQKN